MSARLLERFSRSGSYSKEIISLGSRNVVHVSDYQIYKELQAFGRVKTNVPLAKFTTFKIGGPADVLIEVDDREQLVALLNFLHSEGVEFFILGGGSNVLLPDEGLRGVVVKVKNQKLEIKNGIIEADAGVIFSAMAMEAVKHSLTGLEWAMGLPGTVGGAVRGNAGCTWKGLSGGETKDVLWKVEVWRDSEVIEMTNEECGFNYRESTFKHTPTMVVLRAWFQLKPGDPKESMRIMQEIIRLRNAHYPRFPSGGSFFKNIPIEKWTGDKNLLPAEFIEKGKVAAGWLIDRAGVKGCTVGGAMVSKEHGNFLINYKDATQEDTLGVVDEVKSRVYNTFGVELEEEVQIVRR